MLRLGRKQIEVLASFVPSAVGFGGTAFLGLLYFTDWKVFVTHIPYYGTPFKRLQEELERAEKEKEEQNV